MDFDLIRVCSGKNRSALRFAEFHHRGQYRKSADDVPYFLHPVAVGEVAAAARGDRNVVVAAILHDTVEDTDATIAMVSAEFGIYVAALVDAVSKGPETKGVALDGQSDVICSKLDALRDEPVCRAAGRDMDQLVLDGYVVKGADLLVNITDLVQDVEQQGPQLLGALFGADRAQAKVEHYLRLGQRIAGRLEDTMYARLSDALRARMAELRDCLDAYLTTA